MIAATPLLGHWGNCSSLQETDFTRPDTDLIEHEVHGEALAVSYSDSYEYEEMNVQTTIQVRNLPPGAQLHVSILRSEKIARIEVCPYDPNTEYDLELLSLNISYPDGSMKTCRVVLDRGTVQSIKGDMSPTDTSLKGMVFYIPTCMSGKYIATCLVADEECTFQSKASWIIT